MNFFQVTGNVKQKTLDIRKQALVIPQFQPRSSKNIRKPFDEEVLEERIRFVTQR